MLKIHRTLISVILVVDTALLNLWAYINFILTRTSLLVILPIQMLSRRDTRFFSWLVPNIGEWLTRFQIMFVGFLIHKF